MKWRSRFSIFNQTVCDHFPVRPTIGLSSQILGKQDFGLAFLAASKLTSRLSWVNC